MRAGGEPSPLATDSVLTKAETRVASGYVSGMIGKEIASATGVSHNTVVRHTQNIYEKTGIPHSTNALVAWFLSKNFGIDLDEFRRRVIAVFLLLVMAGQVAVADFDTPIARRPQGRRIEARRGRRRREEEDSDTLFIE